MYECFITIKKLTKTKNNLVKLVFLDLIYTTFLAKLVILYPLTLFYFLHSICHWLKSPSLLFTYVQSSPFPTPIKTKYHVAEDLLTTPKSQHLEQSCSDTG